MNCTSLKVKRTPKKGFGLFATKKINKGSLVFEITGTIKTDEEWSKTEVNQNHLHQICRDMFMFVEQPNCFCNHSCNPNCGLVGKTKFYALYDIERGEEIAVDYDTFEWDWKMKCLCNEKNCRKTIKGFKYLPKKIKSKYVKMGIVAKYLTE